MCWNPCDNNKCLGDPDGEEAERGRGRQGESLAPNDWKTMMEESWDGENRSVLKMLPSVCGMEYVEEPTDVTGLVGLVQRTTPIDILPFMTLVHVRSQLHT